MKTRGMLWALVLTCAVTFNSCKRESPWWEMDITTPVLSGSLSLNNLATDSILTADADGTVRVSWITEFPGLSDPALYEIPDTSILYSYNVPFGNFTFNPGDFITPNNLDQTSLNVSTVQLASATLRGGQIFARIQNDVTRRILVRFEIPGARRNSIPFDTTFIVPAAPSGTVSTIQFATIDMSGYVIDFTGIAGDRVNTLTTRFTAQIDPTETGSALVTNVDSVAILMTYQDLQPEYIRGYFGNQILQLGPEESNLSAFQNIAGGFLLLDSLTMTLDVKNYVGMDARMTINNIWSRNSSTNNSIYLNHPVIGTPVNMTRATYSFAWPPVIPQVYSWTFNNANSNVKALAENLPDNLGYDIKLETNPLGNISGNNDFLFIDYSLDAQLKLDLPMKFAANDIRLTDTLTTNFDDFANRAQIQKGKLYLHTWNSFPLNATVQLYLLDATGTITDSITSGNNTIQSAPVTLSGGYLSSTGNTNTLLVFDLDEALTSKLLYTDRMLILVRFNSDSYPQLVRITNTNRIDFKITTDFTLSTKAE
jgi:hypothetical protein